MENKFFRTYTKCKEEYHVFIMIVLIIVIAAQKQT